MRRNQERVLVTGASMGIGEALARRFARAGHDLVLVARSADRLAALAKELRNAHGVSVVAHVADLAADGEVDRLARSLARRRLAVDILVNNAGINHVGAFEEIPVANHDALIALNISAATALISAFLPGMIERGRGRILNVCSTSSFVPVPFMATYAASKAYLLSLTESLSEECRGKGVSFTALCPGVTATPMLDRMSVRNARFVRIIATTVLSVEEVADAGYQACMTGQVVRIPGNFNLAQAMTSRALPKWLTRRVSGMLGRIAN